MIQCFGEFFSDQLMLNCCNGWEQLAIMAGSKIKSMSNDTPWDFNHMTAPIIVSRNIATNT
jgi:hypothetical protein